MLPNFLIIGAAKAGTTSLYYYLNQHPEIYMSKVKEPRFFAMQGKKLEIGDDQVRSRLWQGTVTTLEEYQALFENVSLEKAIGEASPLYLWSESASNNIKVSIPNVKLIVCLRHPAERAFSHFLHNIRIGQERNLQFKQALEEDAKQHYTEYIGQGMYYLLLKRYYEKFSPEQIHVCLFEDLVANPAKTVGDIYRFLDVNENYQVDANKIYNTSPTIQLQYSLFLQKLIDSKVVRLVSEIPKIDLTSTLTKINTYKLSLSPWMRRVLIKQFKDDIIALQHLINRDLSHWLT
jgi:hypothetical protein